VFEVCDRITVMRGGRKAATVDRVASSQDEVVKLITGSSL
jgi:ABC-type sugar transport system ATPase subunit